MTAFGYVKGLATVLVVTALPSTEAERQRFVAQATKEQLTAFVRDTPPDKLLALSEQAVREYGVYTYMMAKQERVNGKLLDSQLIRVTTREKPFAVRMEYLGGPSHGRVVVFNSSVRAKEFRVREPGFLGFAGPIWLPVDSALAKSDSNYSIDGAGLGNLVRKLEGEVAKAATMGGITVNNEGWNGDGQYCQIYVMPRGGRGFDAPKSRICIDLQLGVPARVESFGTAGDLIGRFVFSEIKPTTLSPTSLDPSSM